MTEPKLAPEQVEALYRRHHAGMYRFLLGVLRDVDSVEEALQQTYLRVIESGHTADDDTMKGWIYKVAFNQAVALRRKDKAGGRVLGRVALEPGLLRSAVPCAGPDPSGAADEHAIELEALRMATEAVEDLPEEQREVLRLRFNESKTFAQIAEHLGVPLGTTLTRLRLALTKLRRRLQ